LTKRLTIARGYGILYLLNSSGNKAAIKIKETGTMNAQIEALKETIKGAYPVGTKMWGKDQNGQSRLNTIVDYRKGYAIFDNGGSIMIQVLPEYCRKDKRNR
jgi:hypothetical protein